MSVNPLAYTDRAIALGRGGAASYADRFGFCDDVDASTGPTVHDVWFGAAGTGTERYPGFTATAAQTITATSSSTADAAAGTGMRTLRITGVDGNGVAVSETLALNGTSGATTTQTFLRVNSCPGLTGGSGETNAGNITLTQSSSGIVMAILPAGYGQTQQACHTLAADTVGVVGSVSIGVVNNAVTAAVEVAKVVLATRAMGSSLWRYRRTYEVSSAFRVTDQQSGGVVVDELTDIRLAVASASDDNLTVAGRFEVFGYPA